VIPAVSDDVVLPLLQQFRPQISQIYADFLGVTKFCELVGFAATVKNPTAPLHNLRKSAKSADELLSAVLSILNL